MEDRPDERGGDELLGRTRELDEARATMDRLRIENRELRRKLGAIGAFPEPDPGPGTVNHPQLTAGYRGEDPTVRLEQALDAANAVVADLRIENAILKSQTEATSKLHPPPLRRALPVIGVATGGGFLWFLTESPGMMLFAGVLSLLGWGILRLIDTIKPGGNDRRPPPYLPGGM